MEKYYFMYNYKGKVLERSILDLSMFPFSSSSSGKPWTKDLGVS